MTRARRSVLNTCGPLSILIALSACGGGGGEGPTPQAPATASTLAYVVTECRADAQGGTIRQRLQIRQGDQAPITVMDTSAVEFVSDEPFFRCQEPGLNRRGWALYEDGVFHRLGVTPDGSLVVFEVTDGDVNTVFPPNALPTQQKGIFAVRADGAGLRRLGPASREPLNNEFGALYNFSFSPNGQTIAYTDRGPSHDNQDATQIFALDLATEGASPVQITQLPQPPRTA